MMGMMGYGYGGFGSWGWIGALIGGIIHLAFLAAAILGVIWLFKAVGRPGQSESDALSILKRRYARGEINSDEYHRMKQELE